MILDDVYSCPFPATVYPLPPYDDSMVDRFSDPGVGAFTYNRGRQFTVSKALTGTYNFFRPYENDGSS